MQKVLFLCTGNYYRSRFAEHLFNYLAIKHNLNWRAISRGLALERGVNNIGAMSHYAVSALVARDIILTEEERLPLQAMEEDFQSVHRIIALDELEHQPLILERFPGWVDQIEYWLIHDVDKTDAQTALLEIEKQVMQLIDELKSST
jgi:protein-tyrosine phosphatase